jgi:succinate dehydrogenase/fumarate reductase cytochrome b subunit
LHLTLLGFWKISITWFFRTEHSILGTAFVEVFISAKLLDNILATIPPSATGISRVVADVGAPGGESGNI